MVKKIVYRTEVPAKSEKNHEHRSNGKKPDKPVSNPIPSRLYQQFITAFHEDYSLEEL
jgi:hypothetical protein